MLNRWIGIACAICMLSANAALLIHDVMPNWTVGNPPDDDRHLLGPDEKQALQIGIFDAHGRNIGDVESGAFDGEPFSAQLLLEDLQLSVVTAIDDDMRA